MEWLNDVNSVENSFILLYFFLHTCLLSISSGFDTESSYKPFLKIIFAI